MRFTKYISILFALLLFFAFTFQTYAKEGDMMDLTPTATISTTPAPAKVEYELPYPGMLPDNPLYFLKAFRDRLIGLLINDPLKRAQFNLLTSDKRLNAALSLIARNKKEEGVSVASKSNNYMELALVSARNARKSGENTHDILSQMQTSVKKHIELLKPIPSKVDKKYRTQLEKEIDRLEKIGKNISKELKSAS